MASSIMPSKIIISIGAEGKSDKVILQYKVEDGGSVDKDFRTINVIGGIKADLLDKIILNALQLAKKGEGTETIKIRESINVIQARISERLNK